MSLPLDTFKEIQKPMLNSQVTSVLESKGDLLNSTIIAVPEGTELIDLEAYKQFRDHYRFNFSTTSIPDYSLYCDEFQQPGAKCFIDAKKMIAATTFDLGSEAEPLHQKHTAELALDKTAAYLAILDVNGQKLSQLDASNFIDDWSDNISVYNQDEVIMTNRQASEQLRDISIDKIRSSNSKVGSFSESMSQNEIIEAKKQESLPADIHFTCQPYTGLDDRCFVLRVQLLVGGDKPFVSLRIIIIEAHKEDMANEFKDIIVDKLKATDIKTFIGRS